MKKLPEAFHVCHREPLSIAVSESNGEVGNDAFAISRPFLSTLHSLDNLAPNQPVGQHHLGVDGAHDIAARLVQDGGHAAKQRIGLDGNQLLL
ncbi:MAG: hypothetical protein PHT20_15390 [Rhodoferax sp.]|nr:hypothetical protein [Rhodoferax sp.]MDD5481064.1 hypothetical protein [Rhodoferax sp.]